MDLGRIRPLKSWPRTGYGNGALSPRLERWTRLLALFFVGFFLLNALAFLQVYRFTHPVLDGTWTEKPGRLGSMEKVRILLTGVTVPKTPNRLTPNSIGHEFTFDNIHGADGIDTPVWEIATSNSTCTVLMFHGYGSHKEALLPLASFFLDEHCDLVLADFPGHGDSTENWTTVGYREAGVVRDVYDHYRARASQPVLLYGQSVGATAILGAVSRYKIAPEGLVLEMPYGSLLDTVRRRFELMGFPVTSPFAEMLVFWGGVEFGTNGFDLNPVEYAKQVSVPALLLGGQDDYQVSPEVLRQIASNMPVAPWIREFEGHGHESLFAADSSQYEEVVHEFLSSAKGAERQVR